MNKIFQALVVLLLAMPSPGWAADDFQYWSQYSLKIVDGEKLDFITYADLRFKEDFSKLGLTQLTQKLVYDLFPHLSLGANYSYISSRRTEIEAVNDDFRFQHRLEAELNPSHKFGNGIKLAMRNRLEYRWIETFGSNNTRYRQRWSLEFPAKKDSFLKSFYVSAEGFYDSPTDRWNEARVVPMGFNIPVSEKATFSPYYMVQFQKGSADWISNQVIGTLLTMSF